MDLSKHALRRAAKRQGSIEFAVASVYDLPVADQQIDLLVNCFSPLALEEFLRVLRPGGLYCYVVPGAATCGSSSRCSTTSPTATRRRTSLRGFPTSGWSRWRRVVDVAGEALRDLFQMTPYYWKTPKTGAKRLADLESLTTRISFRIHIFQKL